MPTSSAAASNSPARDQPVTRDLVLDTALRLVEEGDLQALTMRRLAAELGTAVTAIYWHVGNRDALLDLLVDRLLAEMEQVRPAGRSPRSRLVSLVRQWRTRLWERPHLIALAHDRGQTAAMFQPLQAALAMQLAGLDVTGRRAALVIRALQVHVTASVVLERTAARGPAADVTDLSAWPADVPDRPLLRALAEPMDYRQIFEIGLEALLDRLLPA